MLVANNSIAIVPMVYALTFLRVSSCRLFCVPHSRSSYVSLIAGTGTMGITFSSKSGEPCSSLRPCRKPICSNNIFSRVLTNQLAHLKFIALPRWFSPQSKALCERCVF
uniref:Putative secreted protein n=1 Tax=Anopheles darlingi TaxID=43151 RepID=A0A2M4DBP0_ANODA